MSINIFNEEFKKTFFENHFGKNYLFKSNFVENHNKIMSLDILNKMISIKNIWNNKNFIMMLDRKMYNFSEFSSHNLDVTGNHLRPDVNKVQNLVSKGASIILNDIEKHNPELTFLSQSFQTITQGRCQGNLYFSMESHQAFGPHCDEHDVFAVHFEGEKVWNIYENIEKNPINHPLFKFGPEERIKKAGNLIDQVTLKPGDLLYIPRGQYHDALASQNGAIHIAFGLTYFKPVDLMSILWEKFILNEFMRSDIKVNSNIAELKKALSQFSKELDAIINSDETANILASSIKNWPYEIKNYSLNKIVSDGRRYEVSKSIKLEKDSNHLYLTNQKDKVKVPKEFSSLTEFIMKQETFTYNSLVSEFNSLSEKSIKECINNLKNMRIIS